MKFGTPTGRRAPILDNRVDLAGAVAFVAVGITVLVMALNYPASTVEFDAIGPMGFPYVLGSALVGLGVLQAVRTVRLLRRFGIDGPDEGTADEPEYDSSTTRALSFIGGSFVYMFALAQLGFFVATVPALALALWSMNYRRPLPLAAVSICFSVIAYVAFYGVLAVPLPAGPFELLINPLVEIAR